MNETYKVWVVWIIPAALVVTFGFLRGWTPFHKIMLAVVAVLGGLQLVLAAARIQMLRHLKGMSPEDREKLLARFDQETQALLRKQLESLET